MTLPPPGLSPRLGDALLGALFDAAADGIIVIDERGCMLSANPAVSALFGYSLDELRGRNVSLLMPPEVAKHHDEHLAHYLRTGEARIIGVGRDAEGLHKDGHRFPLHLSVGVASVDHERYFIGILTDIGERKALELGQAQLIGALERKNAELESFTYTVSHDLKSPLVTIRAFASLLERDARQHDTAQLLEDIGRISAAAARMQQLLDDLLALSRLGRTMSPPEPVSLDTLVEEVRHLLSGPLESARVQLVAAGPLPSVYVDRVRMREVLQNLVENAIKFMGTQPNPCITLSAATTPERVTLCVEDNGIGIDRQHLRQVFDLFVQLNRELPGTGVGLALVKRIVEVHGGKVWVDSEGAGRGSRFFVELPAPPSEERAVSNAAEGKAS